MQVVWLHGQVSSKPAPAPGPGIWELCPAYCCYFSSVPIPQQGCEHSFQPLGSNSATQAHGCCIHAIVSFMSQLRRGEGGGEGKEQFPLVGSCIGARAGARAREGKEVGEALVARRALLEVA